MLNLALEACNAGADMRERRNRYKRYTYGRQWDDLVVKDDGTIDTETAYAIESGKHPLTNNMLRQLVKCVIGNFRTMVADDDPASSCPVPPEVATRNALTELDCRMLEEFLISGCAIQRVVAEKRMAGAGVWVDNVSPDHFFVNRFTDPRGLDIELIGMLHSMSLREVLMRFAPNSPAKAFEISRIYDDIASSATAAHGIDAESDFFNAPRGRCRVIEVWTLESRNIVKCHDPESASFFVLPASQHPRLNHANDVPDRQTPLNILQRTTMRWHCRFLAPNGEVLDEYDSPYFHGMHPFAVKFFPLTDGEVHSFVEDVLPQQRHINRIITLIDHIMGVSAKGALVFPEDGLAAGMTWEELSRVWARPQAIIPFSGKGGREPKQFFANGENAGAYQLLNLQMQLFDQISGVNAALQGRVANPNTSAALYDAQVRNSATAILDLIESFNAFRMQRNRIIVTC